MRASRFRRSRQASVGADQVRGTVSPIGVFDGEEQSRWLVLACGNELRGDDQVAWRVADRIEQNIPSRVTVWRLRQLAPEWVGPMALGSSVLVMDASLSPRVTLRRVNPGGGVVSSHHMTAHAMVSLASALYRGSPKVWLLEIPAFEFELGSGLSEAARRAVSVAARRAVAMIRGDKGF